MNPSKYSHCKPLFKDDKFVYLFVYLFVCLFVVSMYPFIHPNISNHIHWFSIIIINQNTMNESPISSIEYLPLTKFAIENFLLTKQTHWMNLPSKIYHRKLKKHTLNESQPKMPLQNTHIQKFFQLNEYPTKNLHCKTHTLPIYHWKSPLNESTIKNLPSKISHWKHTHWMNLNQKYQPKMPLKNTHIQKFFPLKNPIENESIIHPPIHHPFILHQQNSSPSTPPPSNSPFHLVSHGTKISFQKNPIPIQINQKLLSGKFFPLHLSFAMLRYLLAAYEK